MIHNTDTSKQADKEETFREGRSGRPCQEDKETKAADRELQKSQYRQTHAKRGDQSRRTKSCRRAGAGNACQGHQEDQGRQNDCDTTMKKMAMASLATTTTALLSTYPGPDQPLSKSKTAKRAEKRAELDDDMDRWRQDNDIDS